MTLKKGIKIQGLPMIFSLPRDLTKIRSLFGCCLHCGGSYGKLIIYGYQVFLKTVPKGFEFSRLLVSRCSFLALTSNQQPKTRNNHLRQG